MQARILPLESELSLRKYQLPSFKTHPNFSLPGPPIEVALGPIAIGLAMVAFQAMLLGGLRGAGDNRQGREDVRKRKEEEWPPSSKKHVS